VSHPPLAPNFLRNIIDDSPEDGEDPASLPTSRARNQPKRQTATVPGMLAALQTTKAHMEQQQQQQQQRAQQQAAANAQAASAGTLPMSMVPMTPAPEAIPRAVETEAATGVGVPKTPAPKGQGKKKQKRA
jgi:hypothetical protein